MKVGIVGLPNAGKSSLFNILTGAGAHVDLYPFTTVERNVGVVLVPDERLERIAAIVKPRRLTRAHIDFVDVAGLVKGASHGEGLGNRFLADIREADILLHVVRGFDAADIPHVLDTVDPDRDADIVEAELALADLAVLDRWLDHARKEARTPEQQLPLRVAERVKAALERGDAPAGLTREERFCIRGLGLFAVKPALHALNCSDAEPPDPGRFPKLAAKRPLLFSAALEAGMAGMAESDRRELRTGLGLSPAGTTEIVSRCFDELGLMRFYTVKGEESRAWSAVRGTTAVEAAAAIHTDIGRGFIKAEVVSYQDLIAAGDFAAARAGGKVKVEGKNYVVQDGDILLIRFRT
ncbi:redox-regulated ATPase YchF [candidate division WOR-3 bacterium]|nr:redox-regulated ATPase YchF [candidate division WOR-3 bacterium]